MNSICVYCGSSYGIDIVYRDAAFLLGKILAEKNITLVYGGASVGLMGSVADGCLSSGGKVIGVIPDNIFNMEVAHHNLTDLRIVKSMHERKTVMFELADGFISLPGGIGTLEEFFEVLTWQQLGMHNKPIGLLNIGNFYDRLFSLLHHISDSGFMRREHIDCIVKDSDPEKLIKLLLSSRPVTISKLK